MNRIVSLIVIIEMIFGASTVAFCQKVPLLGIQTMRRNVNAVKNTAFGLRALQARVSPASLELERLISQQQASNMKMIPLPYVTSLPAKEKGTLGIQLRTPGFFITPFSQSWSAYQEENPLAEKLWSNWLERAFVPNKKFRGYFVASLQRIEEIANRPVENGVSAQEALKQALGQANQSQYGFLVVAVEGNAKRAKEVMVMDLQNNQWIAFNLSKGRALAANFGPLVRLFHGQNLYLSTVLGQQGILVRQIEGEETAIEVSLNGLLWKRYDVASPEGKNLLQAWENEFSVKWDESAKRVLFAAEEEAPYFSSVEEVQVWQKAQEQQIPVQVQDAHLKLFFPSKNLDRVYYLNSQNQLVPVAGTPVTNDAFDGVDAWAAVTEVIARRMEEPESQFLYHRFSGRQPDVLIEYLPDELKRK